MKFDDIPTEIFAFIGLVGFSFVCVSSILIAMMKSPLWGALMSGAWLWLCGAYLYEKRKNKEHKRLIQKERKGG